MTTFKVFCKLMLLALVVGVIISAPPTIVAHLCISIELPAWITVVATVITGFFSMFAGFVLIDKITDKDWIF
jgi:uncharacterized membrane protein